MAGNHAQSTIDTIRTLALDAVEKANSGHPGAPMGLAPAAYTFGRSSCATILIGPIGPAVTASCCPAAMPRCCSMRVLHLAGVRGSWTRMARRPARPQCRSTTSAVSASLNSKTPGHPEYRQTTGVETTTGPLGQGCGNSVGMAIAGRWLDARFGRHRNAAVRLRRLQLLQRRRHDGRRGERGGVARRATSSSPICAGCMTTTR